MDRRGPLRSVSSLAAVALLASAGCGGGGDAERPLAAIGEELCDAPDGDSSNPMQRCELAVDSFGELFESCLGSRFAAGMQAVFDAVGGSCRNVTSVSVGLRDGDSDFWACLDAVKHYSDGCVGEWELPASCRSTLRWCP